MAGSAAPIVLTLQTVQSTATGLLYILLFGIGLIAGMALLSTIIAIPMRYSPQRLTRLYNCLHSLVGVLTITIGSVTVMNYLDTI